MCLTRYDSFPHKDSCFHYIKFPPLSLFMRDANVTGSNELITLLVITHCSWVIEKTDPIFISIMKGM